MLGTVPLALAALAVVGTSPVAAAHFTGAHNARNPHREFLKRAVTSDVTAVNGKSFDFVIVGGGLAGLVVANRLSEWSNQTVLVIEAGGDGSDAVDQFTVPGYSYHRGIAYNSPYGWNFSTSAQSECYGTEKKFPLGRGLGGSGSVNGMFWGRADAPEYNAWANLNPGGEQDWGSDNFGEYIKKSENLTPPREDQIAQFKIPVVESSHGKGGPLQIGWSNYIYPVVERWVPTWEAMGFPAVDHGTGKTHGVSITPSTLDVSTGHRSSSKTAYLDGVTRSNLVVITSQHVNKVVFNGKDAAGKDIATGVEFSAYAGGETYSVTANKEVILSAGTVGSPIILQRSGVGPADLLNSLSIPVIADLPVGFNLQEHLVYAIFFNSVEGIDTWNNLYADKDLAASALEEWRKSGTGLWTYLNEAVGYVSGADIGGGQDAANAFADNIDVDTLVARVTERLNLPASVANGLRTQYYIQKDWHKSNDIGQFEIIFHLWGKGPNNLGFQLASQHPWSRGRVSISSADPFAAPVINPDYFGIDLDAQMMNQATEWVRKMARTPPMGDILLEETIPGANVTGDALTESFKRDSSTEFHPLGTCAMLPKNDGGVVDTNLRVYGTSNLRVIDASIMPMQLSAHLMGSTYGIAEKGSDIIKSQNMLVEVTSSSSSRPAVVATKPATASSGSPSADASAGSKDSEDSESNGLPSGALGGAVASSIVSAIAIVGLAVFY